MASQQFELSLSTSPDRTILTAKRPTSSDRPRSAARAKAPGRPGGSAKRDAAEIRPASPTE